MSRTERTAKRALDVVVTAAVLVPLAPVLLVIAFLVRRHDRGPVLFRQERIGYRNRPFVMYKFRTMSLGGDDQAHRDLVAREVTEAALQPSAGSFKLADDVRITPIGRRLRALSLDELPQLLNVLRGDMSLVGPRPALSWEVDLFPAEYRRRTTTLPGITGLWQVNGRSLVSTVQMLRYDMEYLETMSFWLDLRILARTIPAVVRGDGAR
jgi:lipopolysaccharide/colanic/teichoic acid biosynthesis glycosyltransferase